LGELVWVDRFAALRLVTRLAPLGGLGYQPVDVRLGLADLDVEAVGSARSATKTARATSASAMGMAWRAAATSRTAIDLLTRTSRRAA
jgi:hypothetical protein